MIIRRPTQTKKGKKNIEEGCNPPNTTTDTDIEQERDRVLMDHN